MTTTVTIPAGVAMWLAAGHLNHLHAADQDEGCCPTCCGPCLALKTLLDAGQLDNIVRGYARGGWECWDSTAGQVDRAWLSRAWRMTECHEPGVCDQCADKGWVRIIGKVIGAPGGYETVTECMACNPDGRIPWRGQIEFHDEIRHHLAHQTPPGVFDPKCPACKGNPR